ncbi:tetratricopeptide repeat protein [Azospirillum isscasi]|uniref:Tetratricopeptide repeat protein n=1 Tax=Azospirillum isscasi TaxID=3053926 RepID=A0ABU0WCX2_9PROT|nr:tetratricopeptide repeat protein [Azospirillum isscasi]MDQ2102031.1 tetratricopeptide repeat protein [Azospirillum isscasi]
MATIAEALALALDHHLAGRLAEAQQLYNRILDVEPDQPDALHFLGVLAGQVGEQALGLQLIARAIAQRPEAADMHANSGNIRRSAGQPAAAVADYRRAVALQPDFAEAWTDMANALRSQGQSAGSIAALERAVASTPTLTIAVERLGALLHERGRILVEQGLGVESLRPLARAAELLPLDADIAFLYGNALFAMGLREDSTAAYRNALAITPDFPSAAFNLGVALGVVDRLAESARALEQAARLDVRHLDAIDRLVVALALLGREAEAGFWGERALDLKDRTAVETAPALPTLPAQPRGAERRQRNVIAFSLWSGQPTGTHDPADILRQTAALYPGWTCRVHHDGSLSAERLAGLVAAGADLVTMDSAVQTGAPYWRLAAADDPMVLRFLCRDWDSPPTMVEKAAVDAWIASGLPFHVMRDGVLHTEVMSGGHWGGIAGLLPDLMPLAERHAAAEADRLRDHRFLRRIVWPMIRNRALVHDRSHPRHGFPFPEA